MLVLRLMKRLNLVGEIKHNGASVEVVLSGDAYNIILCFEQPLLQFCKESVILNRVCLLDIIVEGYFVVSVQGQVIGFCPKNLA